jgi:hypothetical protein|uniref:Uncharacterized protein n=1 Tax=viral metagenome TaxID=1070528 RepID=A0A6C0DY98_9ZZZZ
MTDFSDDMGDIPEQSFENERVTEKEVRLIEASEPPTESQSPTKSESNQMTKNGKVKPEPVEIINKTTVLPYVTSQSPRNKHFKFINDSDTVQLTNVLESIPGLTVEYNTVRDKPYITLTKNKELVGKIHFLYYNENTPEDKYIKLYLFDFVDPDLYSTVKSKLVNFFENFTPSKNLKGGNKRKSNTKHHRTHKKRRNIRRKKTLRRK